MAGMQSNNAINPAESVWWGTGIGATFGAAASTATIMTAKHRYAGIENQIKKEDAMLDTLEKRGSEFKDDPKKLQKNEAKINKLLQSMEKKGGLKNRQENHLYTKFGGGGKKAGIIAGATVGAGLIGAGIGYGVEKM